MLQYLQTNWLEVLGTTIGLIYLYLEWRASIYLWLTSIIMPSIYMFVYYQHGLYAELVEQPGRAGLVHPRVRIDEKSGREIVGAAFGPRGTAVGQGVCRTADKRHVRGIGGSGRLGQGRERAQHCCQDKGQGWSHQVISYLCKYNKKGEVLPFSAKTRSFAIAFFRKRINQS